MAQVIPGSRNVVPGRVECSVEFRHPQEQRAGGDGTGVASRCRHAGQARRAGEVERIFDYAPIAFDAQCLARSEQAVQMLGYSARRMVSGAGHDTCYISKVAPASMIFIPCEKGISHNEAENILPTGQKKGRTCCCIAYCSPPEKSKRPSRSFWRRAVPERPLTAVTVRLLLPGRR
jgi:N-carbamoyl-L-amino-acid hydrolase